MYNLLEYSKKKIQKKTRPLGELLQGWTSNPLSFNSEYLKYKGRFTGNTYNLVAEDDGYDAEKVGKHEIEIVVPLNQWSNFWRTLNIPLINCAIELILTWSKSWALADMAVRAVRNNHERTTSNCCTNRIKILKNRDKIVCSSCYFVKRKWQETFRTIKITI